MLFADRILAEHKIYKTCLMGEKHWIGWNLKTNDYRGLKKEISQKKT